MKYYLIILICLSFFDLKSQTQSEATVESATELSLSKKKLDDIYKSILHRYSDDTLFSKNFKTSQNAWLIYYKSQIKAMFPDYRENHYGSMLSVCETSYAKGLINLRIKEIQVWAVGAEDDDCSSSIKSKSDLKDSK